jgi:hypothetical protein
METKMGEADKLFQSAIKRLEAAQTRLDELSLVAHTLTPGVEIKPEPDDPARRAEWNKARAARDEALPEARELSQVLYPQKG